VSCDEAQDRLGTLAWSSLQQQVRTFDLPNHNICEVVSKRAAESSVDDSVARGLKIKHRNAHRRGE
jgi:hypothetical protein